MAEVLAEVAVASRFSSAQTALITGASCGIGREIAELFARDGAGVALVARRRDELERIADGLKSRYGVSATAIPLDLSRPGSADQLFARIQESSIKVDFLANSAGFGIQGPFAHADPAATLDLLHLNIVSLTQLTRLCLPQMLERGQGRILNIASIAAFMPGPLMATYYASKAYVLSFSAALAHELRGTGVSVTTLCPGPTRTNFHVRAGLSATRAFRGKVMEPAAVARCGYDAMIKGRNVVIAGLKNRLQLLPTPLLPRAMLAHFACKYNEVPSSNGDGVMSPRTAAQERS
jgi:short-subunit dehydrogenase